MSPADHLYLNDRPVLLVRAAAQQAGCCADHIGRLLRQGVLRGHRTPSGWLVDAHSLNTFVIERDRRKQLTAEAIRSLRRTEYDRGIIIQSR